MKRAILAATAAAGIALAGCTPTQLTTGFGAAAGAAVGGAATGTLGGVVVGTVLGGAGGFVVGQLIEAQQPGVCFVYDQQGRQLYYDANGNIVLYATQWPVTAQC